MINVKTATGLGEVWVEKIGSFEAVDQGNYIINTTSAATVTLPPDGLGVVGGCDGNDFSTYNLTVARNGKTIGGLAEDMTVDRQHAWFKLVGNGTNWSVIGG